jgi:hypothetical protein
MVTAYPGDGDDGNMCVCVYTRLDRRGSSRKRRKRRRRVVTAYIRRESNITTAGDYGVAMERHPALCFIGFTLFFSTSFYFLFIFILLDYFFFVFVFFFFARIKREREPFSMRTLIHRGLKVFEPVPSCPVSGPACSMPFFSLYTTCDPQVCIHTSKK